MNGPKPAALVLASLLVAGRASAQSAGAPQAWLEDRTITEGIGIRTGDFEWHPGISGEVGLDSNFFQRAASAVDEAEVGGPAGAFQLRVTPTLSLRTLDRRIAPGDRPGDVRPFGFDLRARLSYNELIALNGEDAALFDAARNLQGGLVTGLEVGRGRAWSASGSGGYSYLFDPTNQGGYTSNFSRHVLEGTAGIKWQPGAGAFEWSVLRYTGRLTAFDVPAFSSNDNVSHLLSSSGTWKFLPKTAFIYDTGWGLVLYRPGANQNSGTWLTGRLGLSGLITPRFGLLAMGGWATSFREPQNRIARNFDDFIANVEGRFYLVPQTRPPAAFVNVAPPSLALGYARSFQNGYLGDFFQLDRIYGQLTYLFGGVVLARLEGGVSLVNYPDFVLEGVVHPSFGETRIDLMAFFEYRPSSTVGLNVTVRYDSNASQVIESVTYSDDLSFQRFRFFLGARWFL